MPVNLQQRVGLLVRLGEYLHSDDTEWNNAKMRAGLENSWFTAEFINVAVDNIVRCFLQKEILEQWICHYTINDAAPRLVGIVMAGNIPLVGFHDFLSVFIAGHTAVIKPSSKDNVLIRHIAKKIAEWNQDAADFIRFEEMLKGCDAYIATGSNNSSRYFQYYFGKYPHIIRKNRTSVAILEGNETPEELALLTDDIHLYFGMGCRNVTKLYVPEGYNFIPLLEACKKYSYFSDHHKYKNNYDYNLALHILNNRFYMTSGSLLLVENTSLYSPVGQLHYQYYKHENEIEILSNEIQCVVGHHYTPFGKAQCPAIDEYADGVDTLRFLTAL